MDQEENYFFSQNKLVEDKIDCCLHTIEWRLDKLHQDIQDDDSSKNETHNRPKPNRPIGNYPSNAHSNQLTCYSFLTFKAPYVRDFRDFSPPVNNDTKQIQQLDGSDDIEALIKQKHWTRDAKQRLNETVMDYYASRHLIKLIKQKNQLIESPGNQANQDIVQKLRLIDEQAEQVKVRKDPRIFVPDDQRDTQIDWCAISAKLTTPHDAQDCRLMWSNNLHWSISNQLWTKDEDICLINAVAKLGVNNWDAVASELNSNRLAWQCCARYNQEYANITTGVENDDVEKIIEVINLCRIGSYVPWNQVMYFIQFHSLHQVKYQWRKYCSERQNVKDPWTPYDDLLLLRAVSKYGEKDWSRISEFVPGRSNKSCRERYVMRLKYRRRAVGGWKKRENELLLRLIDRFGANWSLIASHFPERNCHQLRNRYELLKSDPNGLRVGPIKHRKLLRDASGQFTRVGARRPRPKSEQEVNDRLREIFTAYHRVDKSSSKSLVCRSSQDEMVYQSLVKVLQDSFMGRNPAEHSLLERIISMAINSSSCILAPCTSTLNGYKAWSLLQEYLSQLGDQNNEEDQNSDVELDELIIKITVAIFLWPCVFSRLKAPDSTVDPSEYQVGSLIGRESKNLYKIRDLQRQLMR